MTIQQWAEKWCIGPKALAELQEVFDVEIVGDTHDESSEAKVQSEVRLLASQAGWRLWRNNVGAFKTDDGGWVRYGLCNESSRMNQTIKSSDLIGIKPVFIIPDMVGSTLGVFVAREVKRRNWKFKSDDPHTTAQKRFIDLVNSMGGDASFTNGAL